MQRSSEESTQWASIYGLRGCCSALDSHLHVRVASRGPLRGICWAYQTHLTHRFAPQTHYAQEIAYTGW